MPANKASATQLRRESTNVTRDKTMEKIEDEENRPSPLDFVNYLPFACQELQLPECVVQPVLMEKFYGFEEETKHKTKFTAKTTASITHTIQVFKSSIIEAALDEPFEPDQEQIVVEAQCDDDENLIQILVKCPKRMCIPQQFFKLLSIILPYQPYLERLTACIGLDKYCLHEIAIILQYSYISEIILDNTKVQEANYQELLMRRSSLKYLSLKRCSINDDVVKNIMEWLEYPQPASLTLIGLNLCGNRITDKGACSIAKALRSNRSLTYLNLAGNIITDKGADCILSSLMEFPLTREEFKSSLDHFLHYSKKRIETISKGLLKVKLRNESQQTQGLKDDKKRSSLKLKHAKGAKGKELKPVSSESFDLQIHHETFHPYDLKDTRLRGKDRFSLGNNYICYLNLAYNSLSVISIRKLLEVFKYQEDHSERQPQGLINVIVEGNPIQRNVIELILLNQKIGDRLDSILAANRQHRRASASANKRKTANQNLRK